VFSSLGNTVIGSNTSSTLLIYATTTFSAGFQMFSNSSTLASGAVLGFQRQNGAGAVSSGFVLGSILFSGYDGSVEGPTAQIRSVFTVYLLRYAFAKLRSCNAEHIAKVCIIWLFACTWCLQCHLCMACFVVFVDNKTLYLLLLAIIKPCSPVW